MGENACQTLAPATVESAELALELAERLATLCFGLGRGKIGDSLGLQEIELAIEKRPLSKLAGLGEPEPKAAQYLHDSGEHGATAVHMKLSDVLAGGAARRRKPQHQPVIEPLSGLRVGQISSPHRVRGRQPACQQ